jgi:hypothetical protein
MKDRLLSQKTVNEGPDLACHGVSSWEFVSHGHPSLLLRFRLSPATTSHPAQAHSLQEERIEQPSI